MRRERIAGEKAR
jgi:hypothetical protein